MNTEAEQGHTGAVEPSQPNVATDALGRAIVAATRWASQRPITAAVAVYGSSKILMLLFVFFLLGRPDDFVTDLSLRWDGSHYRNIARFGYPEGNEPIAGAYAFPPAFPLAIRLLGSGELAPLVVNNVFSIAAVALVARLMGLRAGVFLALFPTWAVYSTTGYSEGMYVAVAASAFLLVRWRHHIAGGWVAAFAATTRYLGGLALLVGLVWARRDDRRTAVLLAAPMLIAGLLVAVWHARATGSPIAYFEVQAYWWGRLAFPWEQVHWYLHGEFTTQPSVRASHHPSYWLLRNYAFTAISVAGTVMLARQRDVALTAYSIVIVALSLCTIGTPAISGPRLLLGAFPAIAVLGTRLRSALGWAIYSVVALLASTQVLIDHMTGFFA